MLRDNLAGLIEPMFRSARAYPLALRTDRKESSDDRPLDALKIPARPGGIYALTENAPSPFHAEPRHTYMGHVSVLSTHYYLHWIEPLRTAASERFARHYGELVVPVTGQKGGQR
jgi:hypothetical protein